MLNRLIPIVRSFKDRYPKLYGGLVSIAKKFLGNRLGVYPRVMGNELKAVEDVLKSSQWNMAYGKGLAHERLEADFAEYIGVPHAIAVGSGGMALQMSMRALGLKPGDEVIHQIDTCSATAMAVLNAGATPIFADVSNGTFMLDQSSIIENSGKATKALIATHMWGNPENMKMLRDQATASGWKLIEDACLSLGTVAQGRKAGTWGDTSVFSFGCIKPIQGGEGGMILTSNEGLARELRAMRHWGDRTIEFGVRDVEQLAWNGRMSEIVAAVVREQLKGYPKHLELLREAVLDFKSYIEKFQGLELMLGAGQAPDQSSYAQAVLKIDLTHSQVSKKVLWDNLSGNGITLWHANFELINSLSFFRKGTWKEWILKGDLERIEKNYGFHFPNAQQVYDHGGIGLAKMNFLSAENLKHLKSTLEKIY